VLCTNHRIIIPPAKWEARGTYYDGQIPLTVMSSNVLGDGTTNVLGDGTTVGVARLAWLAAVRRR
jgi:hypothetical protein